MLSRFLLFATLFSAVLAKGQSNRLIFHHLTEKDGLSNNIVNCFLKDSRGILWIATFDGLNKYDGAHFYTFKRKKDTLSLVNSAIHALCEDKNRYIWGGTNNGIFRYDPVKNVFKNYTAPNSKYAPTSANIARAVQNIICDSKGNVWAAGEWTILKYDPAADRFIELEPLTKQTDSLRYYSVRKNGIIEDPSGNGMWLATRRGLHYYDFKSGTYTNHRNSDNPLFAVQSVSALTKTSSGRFWFFNNTSGHIMGFDPRTRNITTDIDLANELPGANGATLFEDSEGRLWFSTWYSGIVVVDTKRQNQVTILKNERDDPTSIAADFFWGVTEDEDGTVWLGTVAGISKCNSTRSIYRIHRMEKELPFLQNNSIRLIAEDPSDHSWWFVTRGALYLVHYYPATGKQTVYDFANAVKDHKGQWPGPVYALHFIKSRVILSTHTGSWEVSPARNNLIPFRLTPFIPADFEVKEIVEKNDVYYVSDRRTLVRYDSRSEKIDTIRYPIQKLPDGQTPFFISMTKNASGDIWFASSIGWLGTIKNDNRAEAIYVIRNEDVEMSGYFNSMNPDKNGNIWLACSGVGLYRYNTSSNDVRYWDETDGLFSNRLQTAVSDNKGHVWVAANNKFSIFTPAKQSFYNFSVPFNENKVDYENGMELLANGNIVASVINDIIEFFPQRIGLKPTVKTPVIGAVNIAGRDIFPAADQSLEVEPDERFVTLKFGLLTDREIFPYSFEYMLEGFDNRWMTAGPDNQAVYNKLPSGKYTFRLVAKAKDGSWKSPERTIRIHIKTPFFRSAWFYVLVVLITAVLLGLFYRFRTRKQRQLLELTSKAQLLEKEKALVMYENLKQHLNPHFLFNSLTSLGSLIRIDQPQASNFLDKMSKVYRYILKNRDNEVVSLGEELRFVGMYIDLQKTRFEEGLHVSVKVDEEYHHRKIAPVTLQNLVENAIKHNIAEPSVPLRIDLFIEDDYLVVRNNLQRKNFVETSNKQGLANMESLYRYLSNRPMVIEESNEYFTVKIPLL